MVFLEGMRRLQVGELGLKTFCLHSLALQLKITLDLLDHRALRVELRFLLRLVLT